MEHKKIHKVKYLIVCIFLSAQVIKAQDNQHLSLFDCYKLARENHPYFQDRPRIEESSELKLKNLNNQWLPQINANGQATYQSDAIDITIPKVGSIKQSRDQYKAWIDVNQMIYDGGSVKAQKNMTLASTNADSLINESELHKIKDQVNQIYFALLFFQKNIELLLSVQETLKKRMELVEVAVKNGALQQSDLDVIKIEILKNQQQIDELKISYRSGISNLSELTGKIFSDSIRVDLPQIQFSDSASPIKRDELIAMDSQESGLNFSDKFSHSQRLPRVYAFSQAGYGRPGLNMLSNAFEPYYIVGLSVKWTLWDWGKVSHDRQSILIQKGMIESKKQALEKNLRISLNNSAARKMQLENSLITDSAIVELRSNVAKRSLVKLDQGVITTTDYINDLNAETQAKIQLESHKIQLEQEKVNYLMIKGIL